MHDLIDRTPRRCLSRALLASAGMILGTMAGIAPAWAQDPPGAVVQAVPPPQVAQLNEAMRKLSSEPKNLDALIMAGDASLVLHDPEAAANFYARAAVVAPNDPRVRLGYARVALVDRRPVEALLLFDQAEKAGADMRPAELDRALAYDLVGDNASAQEIYHRRLRTEDDAQTRLRLAISLAISGKRSEFEKALYPLLRQGDRGAYRTRAFGLAILGHPDAAIAIADAMMPADLALRMAPYLRYMHRLTRAQQAAAADLGIFPASSEVGRDTSEIANYTRRQSQIAARADASLVPSGAAMGPRSRADEKSSRLAASRQKREGISARPAAASRELPPVGPAQGPELPAKTQPSTFSPPPAPEPKTVAAPPPEQPEESVAQAFADIAPAPKAMPKVRPGAVDMTAFKPKREQAEAEKPKPAKKTPEELYPARHWVQVATGRNRKALGWDWRRISRKAGKLLEDKGPYVTKWVEANRLLAGPYPSEEAAQDVIRKLKKMGIDSFGFTSDAGQAIDKLD